MASYTPTSTSGNDYTKILQTGDTIIGTAGQTIPITVPAGTYILQCYGAQGANGYYESLSSTSVATDSTYCSTSNTSGQVTSSNYGLVLGTYYYQTTGSTKVTVKVAGKYKVQIYQSGTGSASVSYGSEKISTSGVEYNDKIWEISENAVLTLTVTNGGVQDYSTTCTLYLYPYTGNGSQPGGYGGYSRGIIFLKKSTLLYLVTGNQDGFNGGGSGAIYTGSQRTTYAGNGGGASDIRIGTNDVNYRVMVAGGGGGSTGYNTDITTKQGGGETGNSPGGEDYYGTQTTAGANGGFGYGGDAVDNSSTYGYGPGGGGGGWYGGGSYRNLSNDRVNGGGSGYILTSSSYKPTGYALSSEYYLTDASTTTYNWSGDGYIDIYCQELAPSKFFFFKIEDGWVTAEKIFKKTENGWQGGEI